MPISIEDVKRQFPIHWMVWNNQCAELKNSLDSKQINPDELEAKDPRGRTPLLLAVTLGHLEATQILLDAGADVNCEKDGWTAVQEATATGDAELLALVLSQRDRQRHLVRSRGVPELLKKLSLAPDFYVEMKWEFTSWVPLVSRMCPFDTYKVYKRGANVRVDTTLVGFENNRWERGDRTYIFTGQGTSASLVELDHEQGTSWCEELSSDSVDSLRNYAVSSRALQQRLAAPLAMNYLDTDNISFERNKSGIWGWRQDKTENVNGYECKVFGASNVQLVSKTRNEHVSRENRSGPSRPPLAGLLALAERDTTDELLTENSTPSSEDVAPVSWEEYFSDTILMHDIGRPKNITTKLQKFKATLWLCEDYPLELQEQIMPILDLMASMSSPHFAKLKDFIQMQLPAGFPVKIEIPLFHVLNARVTFCNIFGTETKIPNVETIQEGERLSCIVDDACFAVPTGYRDATTVDERHCTIDGEEELLQYAIEQSLMEAGTQQDQVDVWEALRGARPASPALPQSRGSPQLFDHEERQLQRAIEASLSTMSLGVSEEFKIDQSEPLDKDLAAALQLSALEQERSQKETDEEQRALAEAIRLSLLEK